MSELRTNRIIPRDGLSANCYGGIIQVKQSVLTTSSAIATGHNFTDSGLAVTITPTRSDSRILVMSDITCGLSNGYGGCLRLLRGSTHIYKGNADGNRPIVTKWFCDYKASNDIYSTFFPHFQFIDSPSTNLTAAFKYSLGMPRPYIQLIDATTITSFLSNNDRVAECLSISISSLIDAVFAMYVSLTGT